MKTARFALDSSCLIPLIAEWHSQHQRTLACYEEFLAKRAVAVLPVHVILESFSVLTRLPPPRRMLPETVKEALEHTFLPSAVIPGVEAQTAWSVIEALAHTGSRGGGVYDALIAYSAARAGATVLLTWNVRHFLPLAPPGLEVREP